MEKTIEFKIPDGYIFDKDNSTENIIRFKPIKKKITYKDVKEKLFSDKEHYVEYSGTINSSKTTRYYGENIIIATSIQQIEQILALNKLMNVAKYLNGDWEPDWNNEYENKFYIFHSFGKLNICNKGYSNFGCAVFKSRDLVFQAIEILGEKEIKKALGIFK